MNGIEPFGNCELKINEITRQMQDLQDKEPTNTNLKQIKKLQEELDEELKRKDIMWKQRSREQWLTDGDRNTSFFHLSTKIRRQRNQIAAIKINNNEWIT